MIIYKVTNLANNKLYIGQTRNSLRIRQLQHLKARSHCSALAAAIRKYGPDHFVFEIIETVDHLETLSTKEIYYIKHFNSLAPNGYNLTEGGENASHTEESRKKLSEAHKGAKNPMYGKSLSAEHKAKISASLMGKKRPQEVKEKIKANHNPKSNQNLTYRRKTSLIPNN